MEKDMSPLDASIVTLSFVGGLVAAFFALPFLKGGIAWGEFWAVVVSGESERILSHDGLGWLIIGAFLILALIAAIDGGVGGGCAILASLFVLLILLPTVSTVMLLFVFVFVSALLAGALFFAVMKLLHWCFAFFKRCSR